ncbi:MAG: efflux transporter outer membrane subunit [Phycisphaerales bacterium]|nr:efflux transporter outer membrane subunit [Planctomycetota bacterium]
MNRGVRFILCSVIAAAAGCKPMGPDYSRPTTQTPEVFRGQAAPQQVSIAQTGWWEIYKDPALAGLIREGFANNFDSRIAVARVEQARQLSMQARSQYYPSVGYQGGTNYGKNDFVGNPVDNSGSESWTGYGVIAVNWELDVWGRIRRLNEAALARYLATEEARNAIQVSLLAEIATAYFELLELDLEKQIAIRTAKSFSDSLHLFSQRLAGGAASKLETSRAAASLASVTARIPDLERVISLKENELCVLIGRIPGPIERTAVLGDQWTPPEVPAGIPSQLLERRPDIRSAEQQLRAANAEIGVAEADYFPKIGLTTYLGAVSSDLVQASGGGSWAWALGANLTGPIFSGGKLDAQLAARKAAWDEARLNYQKTALIALREVSDSLIDREKLAQVRTEQEKSVSAHSESVDVATKRYAAGKASYFEVLDAQQELYPAENTLAQVRLSQLLAVVKLYKALGGGWDIPDPVIHPPKAEVATRPGPVQDPETPAGK